MCYYVKCDTLDDLPDRLFVPNKTVVIVKDKSVI